MREEKLFFIVSDSFQRGWWLGEKKLRNAGAVHKGIYAYWVYLPVVSYSVDIRLHFFAIQQKQLQPHFLELQDFGTLIELLRHLGSETKQLTDN